MRDASDLDTEAEARIAVLLRAMLAAIRRRLAKWTNRNRVERRKGRR